MLGDYMSNRVQWAISIGLVYVFWIDTSGLCIPGMCQVPRANARSPVRGDLGGSKWYKNCCRGIMLPSWALVSKVARLVAVGAVVLG